MRLEIVAVVVSIKTKHLIVTFNSKIVKFVFFYTVLSCIIAIVCRLDCEAYLFAECIVIIKFWHHVADLGQVSYKDNIGNIQLPI